jgi:hypothetical protein
MGGWRPQKSLFNGTHHAIQHANHQGDAQQRHDPSRLDDAHPRSVRGAAGTLRDGD